MVLLGEQIKEGKNGKDIEELAKRLILANDYNN